MARRLRSRTASSASGRDVSDTFAPETRRAPRPSLPAIFRVGGYAYDASYPDWIVNPPTPAVTAVNPASVVVNTPTVVTITGTGFTPASRVWADEEGQSTTYVSSTTLRYTAEADQVGSQTITVHNGSEVSAGRELTVTATAGAASAPAAYDPGEHTVAEVLAYADEHPDELRAIYDAEVAGKARSTLLDGLVERGAMG